MNHPSEPTDRRTVLQRALLAMEEMQSRLDALQREKREPIAIIGMGCRFPGHANDPGGLLESAAWRGGCNLGSPFGAMGYGCVLRSQSGCSGENVHPEGRIPG